MGCRVLSEVDADNGRALEFNGQADGPWRRGPYFASHDVGYPRFPRRLAFCAIRAMHATHPTRANRPTRLTYATRATCATHPNRANCDNGENRGILDR